MYLTSIMRCLTRDCQAHHNPTLMAHMLIKRISKQIRYFSKTILDEINDCIASNGFHDIIETTRSMKFFMTIADSMTDKIIRIRRFLSIEINEENFKVKFRDAFLCFEIMKVCEADAIVRKTVDVLSARFGLNSSFLMCHCYDGASIMLGCIGCVTETEKCMRALHVPISEYCYYACGLALRGYVRE